MAGPVPTQAPVKPAPVRTWAQVLADAMAEDKPREAIRRANWKLKKK